MCGIAGFWGANRDIKSDVVAMSDAIQHRGPDDSGYYIDYQEEIALIHRRLSILDLSENARQPMRSSCGRYTIVFNGEIYNFLQIKSSLEKKEGNIAWHSKSDTEVLLMSISILGLPETLKILNGMFSFALWDHKSHSLTLARDRIGEKPVYYGWVNGIFMFASELKAMRQHSSWHNVEIDRDSLNLFVMKSTVPSPGSIYKGIFKLRAGHSITINNRMDMLANHQTEYWSLSECIHNSSSQQFSGSLDDATEQLNGILRDAVSLRMISDVPLGSFLSGGYDSSLVTAVMQSIRPTPINTFTIGFRDRDFDEAPYAAAISKHIGTDHSELYIDDIDVLKHIPDIPYIWDEPFADNSQIPTYLLSKYTRENVTVIMSGDGGDELFCGYSRYLESVRLEQRLSMYPKKVLLLFSILINSLSNPLLKYNSIMPNIIKNNLLGNVRQLNRKGKMLALTPIGRYSSGMTHCKESNNIVKGVSPANHDLYWWDNQSKNIIGFENQMFYYDLMTYLPDEILMKVDRATMSVGLESRTPFLDPALINFSFQIPLHMKLNGFESKSIIKRLAHRYIPKNLMDRPKQGFGVPIDKWLRGPLYEWAEELIDCNRINHEGYFDCDILYKKWKQHQSGKYNWSSFLWNILMFQSWLEANK